MTYYDVMREDKDGPYESQRDGHEEWCASCRGPEPCDCGWTAIVRAEADGPSSDGPFAEWGLTPVRVRRRTVEAETEIARLREALEQIVDLISENEGYVLRGEIAKIAREALDG